MADCPNDSIGRGMSILLAEDNSELRELVETFLRRTGFKVFSVENGLDALRAYTKSKGGYDLVVLDDMMPVMGGRETFTRIQEIDPDQRILFTSGYSRKQFLEESPELKNVAWLQKPFNSHRLVATVTEVLDMA